MNKLLLLLALLFPLSPAAHAAGRSKPLPDAELKQYQACHHTEDCVRVNNGCCDCANNGGTVSIHRKHEKKFRALFDCNKTICTQRAGTCMFREPVCKKGFCELGPQSAGI